VPSQWATVSIQVGEGFNIEAKNLSAENNTYVDKIERNGEPYDRSFITYEQIMNGGNLVFNMISRQR